MMSSEIETNFIYAREYLTAIKWGGGKYCPNCGELARQPYKRDYLCSRCIRTFNLYTDSPMEGSRLPLNRWLWAFYRISLQPEQPILKTMEVARIMNCSIPTAYKVRDALIAHMTGMGKRYLPRGLQSPNLPATAPHYQMLDDTILLMALNGTWYEWVRAQDIMPRYE